MEDLGVKHLFNSIYKGKTVLITGDTGFKGTWLAYWLTAMGAKVIGYSIDDSTKPSHHQLLKQSYKSYRGDINDFKALHKVVKKHKPEIVFHLAAQSLVRESYLDPVGTYTTNIIGTLNVLEAGRLTPSVKAIVNVTTDKVYENIEIKKPYKESDRLGGYDMYSSSKACVELLSESYKRSFLKGTTTLLATVRAGNVIGGGDWAKDRLIPDIAKATSKKKPVVIRNPDSIRPWQHVLEPLSGYLLVGQKLLEGKTAFADAWNFGPEEAGCLKVKEVLDLFKKEWDRVEISYAVDKNAPHEAGILMLDHSKAKKELGWKPVWNMNTTISKTAGWYKNYYTSAGLHTNADLEAYIKDAQKKKLVWAK